MTTQAHNTTTPTIAPITLGASIVALNIDRVANTSSASIPLCLVDARERGLLNGGTRVLMSAVGAGLTWGSVYMTWTDGRSAA